MNELVPPRLQRILTESPALERIYLVGGCVRDWLLGRPVKDFDVEVFGLGFGELSQALSCWGRVDLVGRSFGVVKLTVADGEVYDFALPRRDSKMGPGHKGFQVECDPGLPPREAAARRDFTINAMMYDPRSRQLLDFFGGREDLAAGRLRHIGPAFTEDPLRVFRGMQFAGRFNLVLAETTRHLCQSIAGTFPELAVERVREEWFKWAARSWKPAAGLRCLYDSGWLIHFPELAAMVGIPQDPEWHPEGDVWTHTGHCLDALMESPDWAAKTEEQRWVLAFATLLHDTGKASTTARQVRDGRERIVSPGHESVGAGLAGQFLNRLAMMESITKKVIPLVANHMIGGVEPTPRALRRLANRLAPATVRELTELMTADASGRPPMPRRVPASVGTLLSKATELALAAQAPQPILMGRHLLDRGWSPGPRLGEVLRSAFEAQLDGDFVDLDGALAWVLRYAPVNPPPSPK